MSWLIEILAKALFVNVIYPMAIDLVLKRETDPVFKAESDKIYGELRAAASSAERKDAARRLYELQKGS